ncbi:thymidine phosphorylase [Candidatus Bipolaricaulota bacterium]|nr:thymidine phosphorylase [Candidatus Bipolaricaulota bacterium]TFH11326.1 MAG: thymidine phosphorylase [Candidatus Atribacteria bacterium]
MNTVDIIRKKRDGEELTRAEIQHWVDGISNGSIPDYQSSALLMAIRIQGMSDEEAAVLTDAMAHSGKLFTPQDLGGFSVDKHSTGGVGDTTTLVLIPLLAAAGLTVGKLSGRALGHTGGTIDKLESIPGFRTDLTLDEFLKLVRETRLALADHTDDMVPADLILYELRDVTATVDSLPLIVASIMSKKIAGGAQGIVIDVKTGAGAFLPKLEDSRRLAQSLVAIGSKLGRKMSALITDMSQPLGLMIGNALEVVEAIDTLRGQGPKDLADLCCELGAELLVFAGEAATHEDAILKLQQLLANGQALDSFRQLISQQGGNSSVIDDPSLLPRAARKVEARATTSGTIASLNALEMGRAANLLGAGRYTKEDAIDPAVGIELKLKVGDRVEAGGILAWLHVNSEEHLDTACSMVEAAYTIDPSGAQHTPPRLIVERIVGTPED